jgi:2-polyprenyl-6-methoxyphenol hydroxylase-like FAD-dependent oxidoreductase
VLGASIAGLLTGRVLADFFDEVILIDKENLDQGAAPRKAVPQGNHLHAILPPTHAMLQRFLPGLIDELIDNGACVHDAGRDIRFYIFGERLINGKTGHPIVGSTRPFFEHFLRERIRQIDNLRILTGRRFKSWQTDDRGSRITGLTTDSFGGEEAFDADLFVDARGRASTLPKDLVALGFDAPEIEKIGVDLGYTSRLYRVPDFNEDWKILFVNAFAPDVIRGAGIEKVENDLFILTQFGYFGDHAPADDDGFLQFAREHYVPDIASFLERAEPATDFLRYGTREAKMFRYENLRRFPQRLLAIGDTVCSLNPVYGQGMTKAAKEAAFLHDAMASHLEKFQTLDGYDEQVRKNLPDVGAEWAWQLTKGADLAFAQTTGQRQAMDGFMGRYMRRLFLRATASLAARKGIFEATMLAKPPRSLLRPRMLLHALGF